MVFTCRTRCTRARPAGDGTGSLLPDLHAVPADQIAVEKDLLEPLQNTLRTWPRAERDIFELYFIEGFEPDEIAMNLPDEILRRSEFFCARLKGIL